MSPGDGTYALTLATHCLADDPARAATVFAAVSATDDVREAWVGLASARFRLGEAAQAATALAHALSRHALMPGIEHLADQIAALAGAPGWCALATGGRLRTGGAAALELVLDGRRLPLSPGHASPADPNGCALPQAAALGRFLSVRIGGREALGSPIALAAIRSVEGIVEAHGGGLQGWVWHPADPDREPVLHLAAASGERLVIDAEPGEHAVAGTRPMARVRRFAVPAAALAGMRGPFALSAPDGTALPGSPLDPRSDAAAALDAALVLARRYSAAPRSTRPRGGASAPIPGAMQADAAGPSPPVGVVLRRRPVDVVIPVFGGLEATVDCLESVLADVPRGARIVVIDDATPEPGLAEALDRMAARRRIVLIRHAANRGFPASANAGLLACAGRDVVLLNSDARVPKGWLARLREAAYSAPDIGSVTPLSNDAAIAFYPGPGEANPVPDSTEAARLDRLAERSEGGATTEIPVGDAVCLYLRRDCLDATGLMRDDSFAQGYGAEVDFCLRARHLGWRHVAATGVFVAHVGGQSFGAGRRFLRARNEAVLNRLHPGLDTLLANSARGGGLAARRRRLDEARWRESRPRGGAAGRAVLLITHNRGGGIEQHLTLRCASLAGTGERPVLLRPARTSAGGPAASLGAMAPGAYPNLIYAMPSEVRVLASRLRAERLVRVELHHLLGHDPTVLQLLSMLGVPYQVHVHDYAWFCPRIVLVGPERRYCGEPQPAACEACLADAGRAIEEDIPVTALIERSARLLGGADRVIVPSADAATRMRRHFPDIRPVVEPHEDDEAILRTCPPTIAPAQAAGTCRVVTMGAIGIQKGFDVLLDCARDCVSRDLPLEFIVVGHTIDDARLMNTGRVFVTGEFAPAEAVTLIRAQRPTLGLLPSIWPETWCFALTDLWRAGLHVVAFDIGAPAERIIASGGRGMLLPLGLPAPAINNALLAAARMQAHQSDV